MAAWTTMVDRTADRISGDLGRYEQRWEDTERDELMTNINKVRDGS